MDENTYLVLRVTGVKPEALDPTGGSKDGSGVLSDADEIEFSVDTQKLGRNGLREIQRDPQVAAAAPLLPLRLIQPVAEAAPAAKPELVNGATWGVYVTGALDSPYVGSGVTVGILDTGIDAAHEAFKGIELIERDFTGEGNGDAHGHGTHVAGTIFGQTVKGVRFGVAPGVRRALIGKVIGKTSGASTKGLVDAMIWATDNGAQVINMSLGIDFPGLVKWLVERRNMPIDLATSQALAEYRDNVRFFDRLIGVLRAQSTQTSSALIVAAAGNESQRDLPQPYAIDVSLPAAADGIVSVAALGTAGAPHKELVVAPFSNTRAAVAGPGVDVYSAKMGGGYTLMSGTSMATPHTVGIAALWAERQLKKNGVLDIDGLAARLKGNARSDRLGDASYLDVGEGLVTAPMD